MNRLLKGCLNLLIMVTIFSACDDEKEENYSIEPHIEFTNIEFGEGTGSGVDTLRIIFSFTDGDSDFGLDNDKPEFISYPFNQAFFFQENNGSVDTLHTWAVITSHYVHYNVYHDVYYEILQIPDPARGKLVFPRTRKKASYEYLPPYHCADYEYLQGHEAFLNDRNMLIDPADIAVLDEKVRISDTVKLLGKDYYHLQDTVLIRINPNHYNIEVDFLVHNGFDFEEFDWHREFCWYSFDGRVAADGCADGCGPFEVKMLSNKRGVITYNMLM